ncbi:MAG: hypothetical protein ACFFKA_02540 [Candidatus Thorarchaeota archaeon]
MNELALLMNILSTRKNSIQIGASEEEVLERLDIKYRNNSIYFQQLIIELSKHLEPLGMQVRYNPLNSCWFITFDNEVSDLTSANPFNERPSLAATLYCVIIYCLKSSGKTKISEIQKVRNVKHLVNDLRELESLGYIELNQDKGWVNLTPLIGYKLDIPKLLLNSSLRVKEL